MWLLIVFFFVCCLYASNSFRSVFLCVLVSVYKLELVHIRMCEPRAVMLGLLLAFFQSSRPILRQGKWEAFVKEALGVFSVLASLFLRYTTRLPNLLMNNRNSLEQVKFFKEEKVWRHLMYSSHDNLSVFPLLWQCVYMCVLHPLLF